MPDVGIQIPPNLADWWGELVAAGASDLGGLSANGDHISPGAPVPLAPPGAQGAAGRRASRSPSACACIRATSTPSGSRAASWTRSARATGASSRAAARGAPSRHAPIRPDLVAGAIERGREGLALDARGADGDVRRDAPGGDRGHAPGRGRAARGARGRDGHVRREPQHQRLQRLHRRAARSAASARASARPTPTSTTSEEFVGPRGRGGRVRRQRAVHPVGHPPRLGARGLSRLAAAREGDRAAAAPARLQPDGDRPHVRHLRAAASGGVRAAARRRPRLDAGDGRGGAPRRRARTDLAQQAAGRALGADHRARATRRGCARPRR